MNASTSYKMTPLTKEQIMETCPVAFATEPTNPNVSEHYVQANTETVINDLAELGWQPVVARMRKQRKSNTIFSPHQVIFQHPDIAVLDKDGNVDVFPQIVLMNSHDGKQAFKFHVGIFRLVCSNGLVIATDTFSQFRIRHQGYTFDELRERVVDAVAALPQHVTVMNNMIQRELTDEEKHDFAISALLTRNGIDPSNEDERARVTDYTVEQILKPVRNADNGNDLWRVFNVVQEKMIRGGFASSLNNGKAEHRNARPLKNFVRELDLNQELFRLANNMVEA